MGPSIIVPLSFFLMIVVIVVGRPLASGWSKKVSSDARRPSLPPEVMTRLERMEQSIDAIAVEIERISEGQRFTTKLLSESKDTQALPQRTSSSSDVQTP
jgi:hypothetical protein